MQVDYEDPSIVAKGNGSDANLGCERSRRPPGSTGGPTDGEPVNVGRSTASARLPIRPLDAGRRHCLAYCVRVDRVSGKLSRIPVDESGEFPMRRKGSR